jgi:hypothetical protein
VTRELSIAAPVWFQRLLRKLVCHFHATILNSETGVACDPVRACSRPPAEGRRRPDYRGSVAFCRTMNQTGPCPSARVDAKGNCQIKLKPGRYALIPTLASGNVVYIKPRWVTLAAGALASLAIDGGNLAS